MLKNRLLYLIIVFFLIAAGCEENSSVESDTEAPDVIITYPFSGYVYFAGQLIVITAQASDNDKVEKVEFFINEEMVLEDAASPYEYNWDTTGLNGSFNIVAKAWDSSGNTDLSYEIHISIIPGSYDHPPDIPEVIFPLHCANCISVNPELTWECSDPDGDLLFYNVYFGTSPLPGSLPLVASMQTNTSYSPGHLNNETIYYWKIMATDTVYETFSNTWNFTTIQSIDTANMILVQGGSFEMGDHLLEGYDDEFPLHEVSVNSFFISQYEITQQRYEEIMGENPAYGAGTGADFPVFCVNWYDAAAFCNALSESDGLVSCYDSLFTSCNFSANGYRLPTEAEWEYAARGGIYCNYEHRFGICNDENDLPQYSWFSESHVYAVGTKLPNQLDIYDMNGNVFEWCNDWYDYDYYEGSPVNNPAGPNFGPYKTARGGCFFSGAMGCRVSCRNSYDPEDVNNGMGFRIVRKAN